MVVFIIIFSFVIGSFMILFGFCHGWFCFFTYICAVIEKTVKQGDMQEIRNIEKDLSYMHMQGDAQLICPKALGPLLRKSLS